MLTVLATAARTIPKRYISLSTQRLPTLNMSTISAVITHDHREIEDYYKQILTAEDEDAKTRYQNQFTWELARHSLGEELVIYPLMEKVVPGGQAMAQKDRAEHQKVKEQLNLFQGMKASNPEFEPTLRALMSNLSEHIKEEEHDDLPKLEEHISREDSASVAKEFQRTKKFVPTRSHPSAPDKPPFETVVGLMTAPMDKLQDMFRKFPKD
ncbi:hemerythrin HHE cation binding domain protein [Kockovaella imperatae]|uniref:Hemerythrin HHE cation binding domain protein n=1 Tax=Kockovaella imperatae TaxID=4999 RepID=A0A1Y1U8V4_9TREE|nr:hemerythrin HHE cation binding domain protein [Kockovaella imperatae]ORX34470.1 hemerythrin HHE cation binding domain protein [Kockovaella imperatae]